MSGDRMPTAEEAEVLAFIEEDERFGEDLDRFAESVVEACWDAGWLEQSSPDGDADWYAQYLTESGDLALARYRETHGEGRG